MKNSIFVIHKWIVNCPREKGVSFSGKTTHDFHHTETQFRKNYARLLRSICEQMKSTLRDVKYCSKLNNATGTSWINATSTPSASSLLAECISLHCKTKLFRSLSPSQVKWKCFFILFLHSCVSDSNCYFVPVWQMESLCFSFCGHSWLCFIFAKLDIVFAVLVLAVGRWMMRVFWFEGTILGHSEMWMKWWWNISYLCSHAFPKIRSPDITNENTWILR